MDKLNLLVKIKKQIKDLETCINDHKSKPKNKKQR